MKNEEKGRGDGPIFQNGERIWPGQLRSAYDNAVWVTDQVEQGNISFVLGAELMAKINEQGILSLRKKKK